MTEPKLQVSESIALKSNKELDIFIGVIKKFTKNKNAGNLFTVTDGHHLQYIENDDDAKEYEDFVCDMIKRACLKYPIKKILHDKVAVYRFLDEGDIQDECYDVFKQASSEVIVLSEETPVSIDEAQQLFRFIVSQVNNGNVRGSKILALILLNNFPDSDGTIRRNTIIRIYTN